MTNPLLRPSSALASVSLTFSDIDALNMLSRSACTAADYTYGDTAIDRLVLRRLVDLRLAVFVSSPTTTIDRTQITELGRNVLRQLRVTAARETST
jgi:hypothetical protein